MRRLSWSASRGSACARASRSGQTSSAAADGVAARTSAEATLKSMEHAKARNMRRQAGESLPGKCFVVHYYYSAKSVQLANEKSLCTTFAQEYELLKFA